LTAENAENAEGAEKAEVELTTEDQRWSRRRRSSFHPARIANAHGQRHAFRALSASSAPSVVILD
jgi:hypothetical protein